MTFYTQPIDPNLAGLACSLDTFTADFSCSEASLECPPARNRIETLTVCANSELNFYQRLDFSPNFQYVSEGKTMTDTVTLIGNLFGCEIGTTSRDIEVYDQDQCLVEKISVVLTVLPDFYGAIRQSTDGTCEVKLGLECTDLYRLSWRDAEGQTGEGSVYVPEANTSGKVTFSIELVADNVDLSTVNSDCVKQRLEFSYDCNVVDDCPTTIQRSDSIVVCAETEVNLYDRIGLTTAYTYSYDSEQIARGLYAVGNPFGCEIGTKTFEIKGYDDQQCLVEVIQLSVKVIPAIYGELAVTEDAACQVALVLECPENYAVTWQDTDGNSGDGLTYTAAENAEGAVTFTVEYLTDEIILSEVALGCFAQTFTGTYACIPECPPLLIEDRRVAICGEETINMPTFLEIKEGFRYTVSGIDLDDNGNVTFKNEECGLKTTSFSATVFDENDCMVTEIGVEIELLGKFEGTIIYESDSTFCQPKLDLSCPDDFKVTWSDNAGSAGDGNVYEAEGGT
ncbi:MAG: hypothetical protein AAGJ18_10810, partial [Bacteroidota bacterium]